jgi:hypothetical protein
MYGSEDQMSPNTKHSVYIMSSVCEGSMENIKAKCSKAH